MLASTTLASAQSDAYDTWDEVTYYFAIGTVKSGTLALGDAYDGEPQVPFMGCAFAMLRPERQFGRVHVLGVVGNGTRFELDLDRFDPENKSRFPPGLRQNLAIDGSEDHATATIPKVDALVAGWGGAVMTIGPATYMDPVGGEEDLAGSFFITRNGFRDEETKGIPTEDGGWFSPGSGAAPVVADDDIEFHLRIESLDNATPTSVFMPLGRPGDLPTGMHSSNPAYSAVVPFFNTKFGGTGHLSLSLSSPAPAGQNELHFVLLDPDTNEVANETLTAQTLQDGTASIDFPLDKFGTYNLLISGKLLLATYAADLVMDPPERFVLNAWWENVTFGQQARRDWTACDEAISNLGGTIEGTIVTRLLPPAFKWDVVVAGIGAGAATVLLGVKLVIHAASMSNFKAQTGRKK